MRPEQFVHRLIEWIGLRRRQVFAAQADTVERLVNIAKLADLAIAYMRARARRHDARLHPLRRRGGRGRPARGRGRAAPCCRSAVRVMSMEAAKGGEWDHVYVLGLTRRARAGRAPHATPPPCPSRCSRSRRAAPLDARAVHEGDVRRLVHVAMTRARRGLVLAWAEGAERGVPPRPSALYEAARLARRRRGGAARGAAVRARRGPALDVPDDARRAARHGQRGRRPPVARCGSTPTSTCPGSVVRYLELLKLAALIERAKQGQSVAEALPEVNDLLLQEATPDQRELFRTERARRLPARRRGATSAAAPPRSPPARTRRSSRSSRAAATA